MDKKEEFYSPGGFKGKVRFLPPIDKKNKNIVCVDYPSIIGEQKDKGNYDTISRYMNKLRTRWIKITKRKDIIKSIFGNETN